MVVLLAIHTILAATAITVSILGVLTKSPARTRTMAAWLFVTVVVQTIIGDVIYPTYLNHAKPVLLALNAGSRSVAQIFDVKEHLAFFALVLAIGLFVLTRDQPKPTPLVRTIFGCAHGTVVLVAVLGLVVASLRTP